MSAQGRIAGVGISAAAWLFGQQPGGIVEGAGTPGVAGAPVALAGVIMPGVARFIVTLSAQADVFGVGITAIVGFATAPGSMLVPPRSATAGSIVPSGELTGICGVDSGKAAPLVGGPPGVALHTMVEGLPSGDTGDMVPVVLATIGVGIVPSGVPDIKVIDDGVVVDEVVALNGIAVTVLPSAGVETVAGTGDGVAVEGASSADVVVIDAAGTVEPGIVDRNDVAGCADSGNGADEFAVEAGAADGMVGIPGGVVAIVFVMTEVEVTGTVGVAGPICPVGVEQVTTVPGTDGSDASGTGANVVSGVPGWVIDENGLGPLSGEDNIAPGVDDRPMAVVPIVETCARLALQPQSSAAIVNNRCRMVIISSAPV